MDNKKNYITNCISFSYSKCACVSAYNTLNPEYSHSIDGFSEKYFNDKEYSVVLQSEWGGARPS